MYNILLLTAILSVPFKSVYVYYINIKKKKHNTYDEWHTDLTLYMYT